MMSLHRTCLTAALLLLIALAAPATTSADARSTTLRFEDGSPATTMQSWVDASYVPLAPGIVTIHRANCYDGSELPCTNIGTGDIWMSARTVDPERMRFVLSHELGHRFDAFVMTDAARAQFARLVHESRGWWDRDPHSNPLGEQFAEAYSVCVRFRSLKRTREQGNYNYLPTPRQHRRVCRMIRQAARGVYGVSRV